MWTRRNVSHEKLLTVAMVTARTLRSGPSETHSANQPPLTVVLYFTGTFFEFFFLILSLQHAYINHQKIQEVMIYRKLILSFSSEGLT